MDSSSAGTSVKHKAPKNIFVFYIIEFVTSLSDGIIAVGSRDLLSYYLQMPKDEQDELNGLSRYLKECFCGIGSIMADCFLGYCWQYIIILFLCKVASSAACIVPVLNKDRAKTLAYTTSIMSGALSGLVATSFYPLVGKQFFLPEQEEGLSKFFLIIFWIRNMGTFLGYLLGRRFLDEDCLRIEKCFSLAYLLAYLFSILAVALLILFWKTFDKTLRIKLKIMTTTYKAIQYMKKRKRRRHSKKRDPFMDLVVEDLRRFRILWMIVPAILTFILTTEVKAAWPTFPLKMNTLSAPFHINVETYTMTSALIVSCLCPLYHFCVYPFVRRYNTPLKRYGTGIVLLALSFLMSGILCIFIKKQEKPLLKPGERHFSFYNTKSCEADLNAATLSEDTIVVPPYDWYSQILPKEQDETSFPYNISCGEMKVVGNFDFFQSSTIGYYFATNTSVAHIFEDYERSIFGSPCLMPLIYKIEQKFVTISLTRLGKRLKRHKWPVHRKLYLLEGSFDIRIDNVKITGEHFKRGAVYALFIKEVRPTIYEKMKMLTIIEPYTVDVMLILPQYVLFHAADMLIKVTEDEILYTQAPVMYKATAVFIVMFLRLIGIVVTPLLGLVIQNFGWDVHSFVCFGLTAIAFVIFVVLARIYIYLPPSNLLPHEIFELENQKE